MACLNVTLALLVGVLGVALWVAGVRKASDGSYQGDYGEMRLGQRMMDAGWAVCAIAGLWLIASIVHSAMACCGCCQSRRKDDFETAQHNRSQTP